jgi:hypothetical protein
MIATTIMISTSVKPALREVWIFILTVFTFRFGGVNTVAGGFIHNCRSVHNIACHQPRMAFSNPNATLPAVHYNVQTPHNKGSCGDFAEKSCGCRTVTDVSGHCCLVFGRQMGRHGAPLCR